MHIAVANDHAGFPLKDFVVDVVRRSGHDVVDLGTTDDTPVDFPQMTRRVTDAVTSGRVERGLLVCGTGVGAAIAANKVPGIRAAVVHDTHVARQSVEHDDVNVACLGAWIVGRAIAQDVVTAFLAARFQETDPDFRRRVQQLHAMERAAARDARPGPATDRGGGAPVQ